MKNTLQEQLNQIDPLLRQHGHAIKEVVELYIQEKLGDNLHDLFNKQPALQSLSDWYNTTLDEMKEQLDNNLDQLVADQLLPQAFLSKLRSDEEYYMYDIHPFVLQYILWLYVHDKEFALKHAVPLYDAAIWGTLGYRLIDLDIDEAKSNTAELKMLSLLLIQKYEDELLDCFGLEEKYYRHLSRIKQEFIKEELRQLSLKFKSPCYQSGNMKQMADKAVHLFGCFALGLVRFGKTDLYDEYWNVFRCTFAPIQLIDDLQDMEKDLASGHYSIFINDQPDKITKAEEIGEETIANLYHEGIRLFEEARYCCKELNDYIFLLNIEKTRLRFNHHFLKSKQPIEN